MGGCVKVNTTQPGIAPECPPLVIGCVPVTDGDPGPAPAIDQLPINIDPDTGCMWLYVCDDIGWYSICPPDDCCYEPFIDTGQAGSFVQSRCYDAGDLSPNPDVRIIDTLYSIFGADILFPMDWSYTNTTNMPGVLTIHASMWGARYDYGNIAKVPGRILFMLGREDRVKSYVLDQPNNPGSQANTPHNDDNVSYDTRLFVNDEIYPFFGDWTAALCGEGQCNPAIQQTADIDHEWVLQPGETINMSARIAVGYNEPLINGLQETGWLGVNIEYVFQGHNQL